MNKPLKRTIKVTAIALVCLLATAATAIGITVNFVFTPEKVTPLVVDVANRQLNAKLDMGSVELTFFSTFPRFGLQLTDGSLVSKALRDTLWQRTDTLLTFKKVVLVVNPMDYLRDKKINIHRLVLDSPNIYAHKTREG